jgi:hypothetical protein
VDLARTALAGADGGHAAGDDRYLVHLVNHGDTTSFLDGRPGTSRRRRYGRLRHRHRRLHGRRGR